jgi:cytochrome c556
MLTRLHKATALLWATSAAVLAATLIAMAVTASAAVSSDEEDAQIAKSLAAMLRAGRTVVSRHQDRINDATLGDKGFDSKTVLSEAAAIYQKASGVDPMSIETSSRHGKLIRMQMDAIAEVIDAHQRTINRKGVGFKGFIPAVFGRLTNEAFGRRADGLAEMKVTAPQQFIRNIKARADDWEGGVIRDKLLLASWPKDQWFAAVTQAKGKTAHRTAVPEYYGASCLSCHGSPQGEIDITGYPKEGGKDGDLGGVISITLYR